MIEESIPFAINLVKMVKPYIWYSVNQNSACTPTIDYCDNYKPKNGKFRIFFEIEFVNSGAVDIVNQISFVAFTDNDYISFVSQELEQ